MRFGPRNSAFLFLLRTCWQLAGRGERRMLVAAYALCITANAIILLEPLVIARVIQTIAEGGPDVLHHLTVWLGIWLGLAASMWAIYGPGRVIERRFAFRLRTNLTLKLYRGITRLPWSWHQNHHSGETINRVNFSAQSISEFAGSQYLYIQLVMRLTGSVVALLVLAPLAGLIVAVALPLQAFMFRRFDRLIAALSRQQANAEHGVAAGLTDYLGNIATILTLRLQAATEGELTRRLLLVKRPLYADINVTETKWLLFGMAMRGINAAALLAFVWEAREQPTAVIVGTAVAIIQYLRQSGDSFFAAQALFQSLIKAKVNVDNADLGEVLAQGVSHGVASVDPKWREARIAGLSFSYEDVEHRPHLLADVSLRLDRGRRVALVGGSGAGKSTLLRLLRGFHEAQAGELVVDGARQPGIGSLADLSTLVPQDAEIFENTIRYNLTCGVLDDATAITEAMRLSAFDSVLADLPNGLDTDIRERGVNLSGGQKQRLALARGLLAARGSSLLLLDEPTSSLDPATEALVFDRLLVAREDACIVASLHRLHLLDRFDHVYVMEDGRVVEEGSFTRLIAGGGVLARLWAAQQRETVEG